MEEGWELGTPLATAMGDGGGLDLGFIEGALDGVRLGSSVWSFRKPQKSHCSFGQQFMVNQPTYQSSIMYQSGMKSKLLFYLRWIPK